MPILNVEIVGEVLSVEPQRLAQAIADAAGAIFESPPGRTWTRVRTLPSTHYAENHTDPASDRMPVFVSVLHRAPPTGLALEREVKALTHALALVLNRSTDLVHLEYLPPAAGRQAFGGSLVD
jgi:hypothetical protein